MQTIGARDPTHSCHKGQYLGTYKAFRIESINSLHVALISIIFKWSRTFDGVARGSNIEVPKRGHVCKAGGSFCQRYMSYA